MMSCFYCLAIKSQTPPHVLLSYQPHQPTHPFDHRNPAFNLEASIHVFLSLVSTTDALTLTATSPFARGNHFPWAKYKIRREFLNIVLIIRQETGPCTVSSSGWIVCWGTKINYEVSRVPLSESALSSYLQTGRKLRVHRKQIAKIMRRWFIAEGIQRLRRCVCIS